MAGDGFHIQPSDLHGGAQKLEQFAADIGASGQKMKTAGNNLVEHASRDKSGIGSVVVKSFGKALSTTGGVFEQAGRLSKGSSDRLHANAHSHEDNESHTTDSFTKLHSKPDTSADRPKDHTGGGTPRTTPSGGGQTYHPPSTHPHGTGTSPHRPNEPAATSSGVDARNLDA